VEIGIPRGRFTVVRVYPGMSEQYPDGAFIIRIADQDAGVTVITTLSTDDGLKLASGLHTMNDPEPQQAAPVIELPSEAETRVHGGGNDRRVPITEPAEPAEPTPAAPEETPTG
jgi:hypothetical protein